MSDQNPPNGGGQNPPWPNQGGQGSNPPYEDEPTRLGGGAPGSGQSNQPPNQPYGQPPQGQPPQGPPPYGSNPYPPQPGQPPYGQPPQQQPPYGQPPQGQPPYGQPPQGQPPYGNQPGQPPYGQGQPPYGGQPSYGQPLHGGGQPPFGGPPPGYGGPGGPGGGGNNKKGWIIGLSVLAVLVIVGGIGLVFALNQDDDGSNEAGKDKSSKTDDPKDDESDDPKEDDPSDEPSDEGDDEVKGEFEAEYAFQTAGVCDRKAMTNSAPYDSSAPKVAAFQNSPAVETSWLQVYTGYDEDWLVDYDTYEEVSVVYCLNYVEDSAKKAETCKGTDQDDKEVTFDYYSSEYTTVFYEASTGKKIDDGPDISADAGTCPTSVYISGAKTDQYDYVDGDDVDEAINAFIADQ